MRSRARCCADFSACADTQSSAFGSARRLRVNANLQGLQRTTRWATRSTVAISNNSATPILRRPSSIAATWASSQFRRSDSWRWDRPRVQRLSRRRVPTCTSIGFGIGPPYQFVIRSEVIRGSAQRAILADRRRSGLGCHAYVSLRCSLTACS